VSSKIELGIWRVAVSSLETPTAIPVFCVFFSPFESAHTPTTLQRGISPFRRLFTQFDWSSRVWFDHQRSHLTNFFCFPSAEKSHRNSLHAGGVTWALERKSDFLFRLVCFRTTRIEIPLSSLSYGMRNLLLLSVACARIIDMWTILCSSGRVCELRNFFAWDFLGEWVAAWSWSLHGSFSIAALVFERKINWNSFRRGACEVRAVGDYMSQSFVRQLFVCFLLFWVFRLTSESVLFVFFFLIFFLCGERRVRLISESKDALAVYLLLAQVSRKRTLAWTNFVSKNQTLNFPGDFAAVNSYGFAHKVCVFFSRVVRSLLHSPPPRSWRQ
jgi:hypothetical protein